MKRPRYKDFARREGHSFEVRSLQDGRTSTWILDEAKRLDTPDIPDEVESEWFRLCFSVQGNCEQGNFHLTASSDGWEVHVFAVPEANRQMFVTFS